MTNEQVTSDVRGKSRRKLIRNIVIGLMGLTICGAVIVIAGLVWLGNLFSGNWIGFNNPQCNVSNPKGIEEVAEFKLPPSAKLLTSGCGGMQGWEAAASFEMKPSDLNTFLATTSVKPPLSNSNRPEKLHCGCDDNEKITDYLYGQYLSYNKNHSWEEEVFIDTHDKDLYTVYFNVLGG
jgi:hypothetical protein